MYAQTPEVGEQPVKKLSSQSSSFNIYIFFKMCVKMDIQKAKEASVILLIESLELETLTCCAPNCTLYIPA